MTISTRDNFTTTSGALANGTGATISIVQPVNYVLNGFGYLKASALNLPFSAGHTAQLAGQSAAYFVLLDAAGAVTTVQSQVVATGSATNRQFAAEAPNPADKVVIGAVVVTGAFTPGVTAVTGLTAYYNYLADYSNSIPL